jgi:acyl carrier protein
MALSLARGRILGRFRPPIVPHNGCIQLPSSDPTEYQNNTSLGLVSADNPNEDSNDQIKFLASYVVTTIDEIVKFGKPAFPAVYVAEVHADLKYSGSSEAYKLRLYSDSSEGYKLRIISKLLAEFIHFIPEVDKIQIFHAKVFYRSMLNDDSDSDLIKDDVISRVLDVTQSYPKVGNYKVTEETNFIEDLGFGKWDSIEIIQALQVEFKLYIPDDITSCKLAIDYIYSHRTERLSKEEFLKHIFVTGEFGESKSELRRIFVPDKETDAKYDSFDPLQTLCPKTTTWNGFKLVQYLQDFYPFSVQRLRC